MMLVFWIYGWKTCFSDWIPLWTFLDVRVVILNQTILDDKSGYDHLLLTKESRTFFGIQWGGWYFVKNTLPFGWKISPFVYHSTGLMVINFLRSVGFPCSLYIDDRRNGNSRYLLGKVLMQPLQFPDEHNLAAAKSAVSLVAFFLINFRYFLGLWKSIFDAT